ncbi:MAG TPA: hypothetical protein VGX49_03605, partial [Jatrophihabitans sp.]|nr:hypothetical protein [Jatrophihabitans sp.]
MLTAVVTATVVGSVGLGADATAQPTSPGARPAVPGAQPSVAGTARARLKHSPVSIPAARWAAGSPQAAELRRHQASPARPA